MFPINFNFPYRKKDGSIITMEKALDGAGADLDLIDLDDVAITNPADDDGLVYDATSQKWENVPIMTKEQWKATGSYNDLPNNGTSLVQNGVTFTVNSNGTVTASTVPGSPASDNAGLYIFGSFASYISDNKSGLFKLVGSPTVAGCSILYIVSADGSTFDSQAEDTGNGAILTAKGYAKAYIRVAKNADLSTPVTFKPMLTRDLNATYDDYVPYAKTNRELTEDAFIKRTLTSSDNLNDVKVTGIYGVTSAPTNSPENQSYGSLIVQATSSGDLRQLFMRSGGSGGLMYVRSYGGSPASWTSWFKFTGTVVS